MVNGGTGPIVQCGREISPAEIELIQETIAPLGGLSWVELIHTVCDHLEWFTATGTHKLDSCGKLLEKLAAQGRIQLPARRSYQSKKRSRCAAPDPRTDPQPEIYGELGEVKLVELELVRSREEGSLFNEYVDRYHYLGYKKPFGCTLRYFLVSARPLCQGRLGCLLLSGAAKSITVRDKWIGWSEQQRLRNIAWVVNNSRFLIFPWVRVRHLASHVLGMLARRASQDWYERWGYRPVLMETFVDPARYKGISYRAAGWSCLGKTSGKGLIRPGRSYATTPKWVYVRALERDFRAKLCSEKLVGRLAV